MDRRLFAGRMLCGKWRIDEELGEGGTASVWAATHRNGMRVAIKVLRSELERQSRTRARFLREGHVTNRIEHPGVVRVLDDDVSDDGMTFLVMELLEGRTVKQLWQEHGRQLGPRTVVAIAKAVLEVMEAAHAHGVVHRDLKPDNIFLLRDGGIKVMDFGVARVHQAEPIDGRTRPCVILGTPAYMPPEQARGLWDYVDARSDLFALGATMWCLLTGGPVHEAASVSELLFTAGTTAPRPISSLLSRLDWHLASVIDRALCFDRHDRWESAAAMRAALESASTADAWASSGFSMTRATRSVAWQRGCAEA